MCSAEVNSCRDIVTEPCIPSSGPCLACSGRESSPKYGLESGQYGKARACRAPTPANFPTWQRVLSKNYRIWVLKQVQTAAGAAFVVDSDNSLPALIKTSHPQELLEIFKAPEISQIGRCETGILLSLTEREPCRNSSDWFAHPSPFWAFLSRG